MGNRRPSGNYPKIEGKLTPTDVWFSDSAVRVIIIPERANNTNPPEMNLPSYQVSHFSSFSGGFPVFLAMFQAFSTSFIRGYSL